MPDPRDSILTMPGVAGYNPFEATEITEPSIESELEESKRLKIEILKDKFRYFAVRGIHDPNIIIKKVYNADLRDELTKEDIVKAFNAVLGELAQDVAKRDIGLHFLTHLLEYDTWIAETVNVMDDPHTRAAEKLTAINTAQRLSKERLQFLQHMGVRAVLKSDKETPEGTMSILDQEHKLDERTITELDQIKALNAAADLIEVEFDVK